MVHYLSAGMAKYEDRRSEEAAWMSDFDSDFAGCTRMRLMPFIAGWASIILQSIVPNFLMAGFFCLKPTSR